MKDSLDAFLESKSQLARPSGFSPLWMPDQAFPFQADLAAWALELGRGLLIADCGLGKTLIALIWAQNIVMHTNGKVLVLTPLAVSGQFVREGEKFGIPCHRSRDGTIAGDIVVTNYEQLDKFNPGDFAGVVCDESSCLKNFQGKRRAQITEFLRTVRYRLLDTATPAPNDYLEFGTSAEALGHLGHMDMLARFFINDEKSLHPTSLGARWRFKKAAELPFWRWVCSWSRALRRPSDLGYADDGFALPPLNVHHMTVDNPGGLDGYIPGIVVEAVTLAEQRQERKKNMTERCELAASLVADTGEPAVIWTDYNAEADLLVDMIPDAMQVSGSMKDETKEERFRAFSDGELRVMVTKPKIGAWGLNWQHCNNVVFFVSHSFEQYYQSIRRCWRFGQTRPVDVHLIATPGENRVVRNLQRKAEQAETAYDRLIEFMTDPENMLAQRQASGKVEVPGWLI